VGKSRRTFRVERGERGPAKSILSLVTVVACAVAPAAPGPPLFEIRGKDNEALTLRNVGVRADDRTVFVVVKSAWTGTGKDAKRVLKRRAALLAERFR
jgi:hypothetical protein